MRTFNITGNITLSEATSAVLICQQTSPVTITLPTPTADGILYKINRPDSSSTNTVTLNAGSNSVITSSTLSGNTFSIQVRTYTEIISYQSNWYILKYIKIDPRANVGIYATTYVSNNSSPYLTLTGAQTANGIGQFPFVPSLYQKPTTFTVSVTGISGNPTGSFRYFGSVGGTINNVISGVVAGNTYIFTVPITSGTTNTIVTISWIGTSASSDRLGLNYIFIS